jgi:hypothetical protein
MKNRSVRIKFVCKIPMLALQVFTNLVMQIISVVRRDPQVTYIDVAAPAGIHDPVIFAQ